VDLPDEALVAAARDGDRRALSELVRHHQDWIYNVALRMVWVPADAEDVTQEVLVKVVTRLETFRGEASFRTWMRRIAVNHVLTMRERGVEPRRVSLDDYAERIRSCPDGEPIARGEHAVSPEVLEEEAKLACTTGMLLCLDREQRIALLLGGVLGLDSAAAAALLEIRPEAFRQRLARARADLERFLNGQCGLVDPKNPCRCAKKTRAYVRLGIVDPEALRFHDEHVRTVRERAEAGVPRLAGWLELFRSQPWYGVDVVPGVLAALGETSS